MTFLNGIVAQSYAALHDILMEDDNKTYQDCILALRKKGVDTEESKRSCHPLRRIAAQHQHEEEGEEQEQQNAKYLPQTLWESFTPEQKMHYRAHLHQSTPSSSQQCPRCHLAEQEIQVRPFSV